MESTGNITSGTPQVAVLSEHPNFHLEISAILSRPVQLHPTPETRFVILGNDYENFLNSATWQQAAPHPPIAIYTSSAEVPCFLPLHQQHVTHYIFAGLPYAQEALIHAVALLTTPNPATYHEFPSPPVIRQQTRFHPETVEENHQVLSAIRTLLTDNSWPDDTISNTELAAKEALTNAFFHSFHDDGKIEPRYDPSDFTRLHENDHVNVTATLTTQWFHLQIKDNSGSLDPQSVSGSIDRHNHQLGLFDTRGRGFYLMQHLSQRMVITISQNISTTIDLYFSSEIRTNTPRHLELIVH